ncbi:hypothetical protein ACMHYB_28830 [Sorangium sp. So ce1128]
MNKHHMFALPSIFIATSVILGGCISSEPGDGQDAATEAEPGDGQDATTEAEPGNGQDATTEAEPGNGQDATTEAEPGNGQDATTEAEPGNGQDATTEAELTGEGASALLSSWDEQMYTDDSRPGGRVRFETNGDIVEVCDVQADGKSVDVWYNGNHIHVGGNGHCVTRRASNGGSYDLREGAVFQFVICLDGNQWCDEAYWRNNNR